ncbi:glycosyltransferase [Helicobacter japonicus]|uniref:Glycosyltransferase n=4 Tax=Helicobacter japonicus TaxID=425400 RepID=A0A4U8TPK1_9HELI|nr:glycosyltransferase [Helicobacter japonicus]TLE01769.1 glycosyltransferase [Helicobacter japonicus]
MTNAPLFSIIVPIYNVESYLKECLDSILAQTYKDFELILINDGSIDTSGEIAKTYANSHSFITLFNQENSGQSVARNKGLESAKGQYIVFIDADDRLDSKALEYYAKCFKNDNSLDIIYTEFNLISDEGHSLGHQKFWFDMSTLAEQIKSGDELLSTLYKQKAVLFTYTWQGAIARNFLEQYNIRFCEGIFHQDILFGLECFSYAQKVFISPKRFYDYRQSLLSTTRGGGDMNKLLKSAKSYAITANQIVPLSENVKKYVSNETYAFYYRCIRTLLKRIMRILNTLPWSEDKADIIQSIKPLYAYAPYHTKFSMNFPHLSAFLTNTLKHLKFKKD